MTQNDDIKYGRLFNRLIWLLLFILAMIGSKSMVTQVYTSLQLSQIMITLENRVTPVEEIPFPAITITDQIHIFSRELVTMTVNTM
jgi:hypothetical protein